LTACLKKIVFNEKMIEDDLSWVKESASKSTYRLGIGFERCEDKSEKSAPKFIPSFNYHKEEEALKSTKTHYPSNPKPSFNPKREVKRESPTRERKLLFAYFVAVLVTWINFTSDVRDLRRGALSMPKTHIMMSFLIFCLILTLVLRPALPHVLFLSSLMNLIIAHMILVHERTALSLDDLVMAHVLNVVIVSRVGFHTRFEPRHLDSSRFPIMVLIPLVQTAMCKRL
jgi:hypothetical protein